MKRRKAGRPKHTNRFYLTDKEKALVNYLVLQAANHPGKVFGEELPPLLTKVNLNNHDDIFEVSQTIYQKVK